MKWTPTQLVEHILKLENAAGQSDSCRATTPKSTRDKNEYSQCHETRDYESADCGDLYKDALETCEDPQRRVPRVFLPLAEDTSEQ